MSRLQVIGLVMMGDCTFAYKIRVLRVDMTSGTAALEIWGDERRIRDYIGGVGMGTKIVWDETPRNCKALDPENRLVFSTGPLTGTGAPGSGFVCVNTIGPLGESFLSAQAQGYFGAYMRFAGCDIIIVQGAASDWKYLVFRDGHAELRDAGEFLGMDTWEVEKAFKERVAVRPKRACVACIGPAGEHLVKYAAIFNDEGHLCATNGPGCVMGAKKLKAICVEYERKDIPFSDFEGFSKLRREWLYDCNENSAPGQGTRWTGTLGSVAGMAKAGLLPVKNYHSVLFPGVEQFDAMTMRDDPKYTFTLTPCYGCPWNHCHSVHINTGKYAGLDCEEPEYEGVAAMSGLIGNLTSPDGMMALTSLVDHLGMCVKETGFTVSMAIEAYESGVLTKADTDGLELTWGNVDAVATLLTRIAHRDGPFADMLADGVMRASKRIGKGAEDMAVYFKNGIAPHIHDQRLQHSRMLSYCVSDYGANMFNPVEHLLDKNLGITKTATPFVPEEIVENCYKAVPRRTIDDGFGVCMFFTFGNQDYPLRALNLVTGWDYTWDELRAYGYRIVNLQRCINLWVGKRKTDDIASPRTLLAPADAPFHVEPPSKTLAEMKERYYKKMGWDAETTKPLPETLEKYGLTQVLARYDQF